MNWEQVKGFCRRQTQTVNEKYRGVRATRDEAVDAQVAQAHAYRAFTKSLAERLARIGTNFDDTIVCLEAIKNEAAMVQNQELSDMAKRMEMLCLDLRVKSAALNDAFRQQNEYLKTFVMEGAKLDAMLADRKAKLLEFDFFVNKVNGLRADPPKDPSRIPRNEARVTEWRQLYEDANERTKQLTTTLLQNGLRLSKTAIQAIGVELPRAWEECARSTRVMFGANGGAPPPPAPYYAAAPPVASPAYAAAAAPATPSSSAPAPASAATTAAPATPVVSQLPASGAAGSDAGLQQQPSRRRFAAKSSDDDPFKV
jgi:hypothetical protein